MKRIETTIGYREEYDNGEIKFYGGHTENGTCYKDINAFVKGEGVIYISEYSLIDIENGNGADALLWTREMLIDEVRTILKDEYSVEMEENDSFVDFLAGCILNTCDWQELSTLLYELTYNYSIEETFADRKSWEK